jgi:hypothetical protein
MSNKPKSYEVQFEKSNVDYYLPIRMFDDQPYLLINDIINFDELDHQSIVDISECLENMLNESTDYIIFNSSSPNQTSYLLPLNDYNVSKFLTILMRINEFNNESLGLNSLFGDNSQISYGSFKPKISFNSDKSRNNQFTRPNLDYKPPKSRKELIYEKLESQINGLDQKAFDISISAYYEYINPEPDNTEKTCDNHQWQLIAEFNDLLHMLFPKFDFNDQGYPSSDDIKYRLVAKINECICEISLEDTKAYLLEELNNLEI